MNDFSSFHFVFDSISLSVATLGDDCKAGHAGQTPSTLLDCFPLAVCFDLTCLSRTALPARSIFATQRSFFCDGCPFEHKPLPARSPTSHRVGLKVSFV
jgi:hypothetical protein